MQRTRRHLVRGAVVATLTSLLAALLLFAGAGAAATASSMEAHRVSAAAHVGTDPVPAVVPHSHRTSTLQRLDGTGPVLLPDRAGSPRPTYTAGTGGSTTDLPHARAHGTTRGRAPPA